MGTVINHVISLWETRTANKRRVNRDREERRERRLRGQRAHDQRVVRGHKHGVRVVGGHHLSDEVVVCCRRVVDSDVVEERVEVCVANTNSERTAGSPQLLTGRAETQTIHVFADFRLRGVPNARRLCN